MAENEVVVMEESMQPAQSSKPPEPLYHYGEQNYPENSTAGRVCEAHSVFLAFARHGGPVRRSRAKRVRLSTLNERGLVDLGNGNFMKKCHVPEDQDVE